MNGNQWAILQADPHCADGIKCACASRCGGRMRLLKIAAYALFGYVIYQLLCGMLNSQPARTSRTESTRIGSRDLKRALREDRGRMNLTGPGRGRMISTEDSGGGTAVHLVGRGVISNA